MCMCTVACMFPFVCFITGEDEGPPPHMSRIRSLYCKMCGKPMQLVQLPTADWRHSICNSEERVCTPPYLALVVNAGVLTKTSAVFWRVMAVPISTGATHMNGHRS
eukprot:scaffold66322_cov21-Tisochrysis_lutea.AAC.1